MQHYVIKFVSDLLQVPWFSLGVLVSPPIKLTPWYTWNIVESGIKYQNHNHLIRPWCHQTFSLLIKLFLLKSVFSANQIWVFPYLRIFSNLSKFSSFMVPGPDFRCDSKLLLNCSTQKSHSSYKATFSLQKKGPYKKGT
jgi:hypothetical protein